MSNTARESTRNPASNTGKKPDSDQAGDTVRAMAKNQQSAWNDYVKAHPGAKAQQQATFLDKAVDSVPILGHGAQAEREHLAPGELLPAHRSNNVAGPNAMAEARKEQGTKAPPVPSAHMPPATATPFSACGQRFSTLAEVGLWLEQFGHARPETEILITVDSGCHVPAPAENVWHYYDERQTVVLDGQGAQVDGFDPTRGGQPSTGFFLSYRPEVGNCLSPPEAGSEKPKLTPKPANITVRNLSIQGFVSGGIEISPIPVSYEHASPDVKNDPHNANKTPEQWEREQAGITSAVSGAHIESNDFRHLGNAGMARDEGKGVLPNYDKSEFGSGGVLMKGVSDSRVENNHFEDLQNGTHAQGSKTYTGNHLFHAVYMRDASSGNTVANNSFQDVGGDVVRVSNNSNQNSVLRNTSQNAGTHGLVSNFYNTSKRRSETNSTGTVVRGNKIGKVFGGKAQGVAYNRQEAVK